MPAQSNAPIIIKRKKVIAAGGHHGGAWKVAYADFVTAMMAFFMLMWLLGATTESQRKGIADYFSPSIPLARVSGGGDGALGGQTAFSEMQAANAGKAGQQQVPDPGRAGDEALTMVAEKLRAMSGESMAADDMLRHLVTRVTDEGLVVTLFALPGEPLFFAGGVGPTPLMRDLVGVVAEVFALAANQIAVEGHVPAYPIVLRTSPAWDLSIDRAQAMREMMTDRLGDGRRLARVTGHADRETWQMPPMDVRNERIELILLRQDPLAVRR